VTILGKRRIAAAVAAVTGAAVMCIAGPATSASAATSPLYAHLNPVVHKCTILGDAVSPVDGVDYEGVLCVDLRAFTGGPVEADVELLCQVAAGQPNYGHEVQCAEADSYAVLANAVHGVSANYVQCGHTYPACSATRNIWEIESDPLYDTNSQTCASDTQDNYWTVAYADTYWGLTRIELPGSDQWVGLNAVSGNDSGNESTGHYQICP
jgi:hypothetical protein